MLDNADDNDTFFRYEDLQSGTTTKEKPLANFLPHTANGSILITSRNRSVALSLVTNPDNIINIEAMGEDDALALLKTKVLFEKSSETDAKALVQALDGIPLAIIQAGAYISVRAPRTTIRSYFELFRESEKNQTHLLNTVDVEDLRRDYSIRHPVIMTWQISFKQIQETAPAATDLLALMSMFDRQGISAQLLMGGKNQVEFEDVVAPLFSFSLITTKADQQSFEMHRLVQLSMIKWLQISEQLQTWEKSSIQILAKAFPSGEYETWLECQALLPHAKRLLDIASSDDTDTILATLADNVGWYLNLPGDFKKAEAMHRRALKGYEKVLGAEHPHTLTSADNLGSVLSRQCK